MNLTQSDASAVFETAQDLVRCGIVAARPFAAWERIVSAGAAFTQDIVFKHGHLYEVQLGISVDAPASGLSFRLQPTREVLRDAGLIVHRVDVVADRSLLAVISVEVETKLKVRVPMFELSFVKLIEAPLVLIVATPAPIKVERIIPLAPANTKPAARELTDDEKDALVMKALEAGDAPVSQDTTITQDTGLAVNLAGAQRNAKALQ